MGWDGMECYVMGSDRVGLGWKEKDWVGWGRIGRDEVESDGIG